MAISVDIEIKSLSVRETADDLSKNSVSALSAVLHFPRPNVANVLTMHLLKIRDGGEQDFTTKPLSERMLFKQTISGRCELKIELTSKVSSSDIDKALNAGLKKGIPALLGIITAPLGPIVPSAVNAVVGTVFDWHKGGAKVHNIGTAILELHDRMTFGEYRLELKVPKDVIHHTQGFNDQRVRVPVDNTLLRKGEVNAILTLMISKTESTPD